MWILALACQEPFGADRHELTGFRVAAISVPPAPAGAVVTPEAAFVVAGRVWTETPLDLRWYWVGDVGDVAGIDGATAMDGFGPAPRLVVPKGERVLALVASDGDQEERAFLEVLDPPATLPVAFSLSAATVDLWVQEVEGPELVLVAREALPATPLGAVNPGAFVRVSATLDPPVGSLRWMATAGTFFELSTTETDWAAGGLTLDGDEIEGERTIVDDGPVTFLGLALGAPGETRFAALDLEIGERTPGIVVNGRIVPTTPILPTVAGDWVAGTLTADDAAPSGIALTDARIVEPGSMAYGTHVLPCAAAIEGPFDPRVLLTTACVRSDIVGFEVVMIAEGPW